jgi:hypothetical protein
MTRSEQPDIEIIHPGPHDAFRPPSPIRDDFAQRSPRRSSQRVNDDLLPSFQRLDLGGRKDKVKDRRKTIDFEAGKIIRRRSSSGEKSPPSYYAFYRIEKRGDDWTLADRIPMKAPQDELEKRVAKGKSRFTVLDKMTAMHALRRDQINRLLEEKNYAERDQDAEWIPVLIETTRQKGNKVLAFDIVIAQSFKRGGPAFRDRCISFVGEKSDLREPIMSKGRDKDKYKDKFNGKNGNDYPNDPFDDGRLFSNDGRPIESHGRPIERRNSNRHPVPLEDPIAGPIPGLQPMRPPPIGWTDPFRPGEFPQDMHNNQPPVEILNDPHQPHGGQAGEGVLDLDKLLEKPPGGGGGGGGQQHFEQPRLENFPEAGPGDFRPLGPERQRSGERRKSESRRRRPDRRYTDQGPQRRREHSRRNQYGDSSVDGDEDVSVFFDPDDRSSMSSWEDERFIEGRGSLKRRLSTRKGDRSSREHYRRGASYNLGRRDLVIEPGRTPRRPDPERRQTIDWPEQRQITYPYRNGRDRDIIDEPLSPVLTHRGYSPGPRRRESRGAPPELFFPEEMGGKDRRAEEYMEATGRDRYREEEVMRLERELDEKDRRRGGKWVYRDYRDRY